MLTKKAFLRKALRRVNHGLRSQSIKNRNRRYPGLIHQHVAEFYLSSHSCSCSYFCDAAVTIPFMASFTRAASEQYAWSTHCYASRCVCIQGTDRSRTCLYDRDYAVLKAEDGWCIRADLGYRYRGNGGIGSMGFCFKSVFSCFNRDWLCFLH
ncbi:hypothetical protein D3C73_1171750 [compost metagenome]